MSGKSFKTILLATGVAFALSPIAASVAAEVKKNNEFEKITVKARKRDESIIEVPLSVKAFTADDLEEAGLTELESLAGFTPNLDFQNMGNSQPGRLNSVIRFRGMDMTISTPANQTGGFFVDAVNILGGASSVSFTDIAQVEVIRGPQPVYFGRGTFGGAINYTTVTPQEEFSGQISASYSPTFGSNDMNVYVEGALTDAINARLTAFTRTQGAPFTANDGGKLGEETTDGLSLILAINPTDKLSIKTRFAYSEDDDGAPSAMAMSYADIGNIAVGSPITLPTNAGDFTTAFSHAWLQGDVPYFSPSTNTGFYDISIANAYFFEEQSVNGVGEGTYHLSDLLAERPESGDTPSLNRLGLRSDLLAFSTDISYFINDELTFSGLLGYNKKDTTQIRDADQTDVKAWTLSTYLELESWSAEARLNFDDAGDLRWMVGANFSEIDQMGDVDGGWNVWDGLYSAYAPFYGAEQTFLLGYGLSTGGNGLDVTNVKTAAVFGSVEYDINDMITLVAEGRYQRDESYSQQGATTSALGEKVELSYNDFLPRLSVIVSPNESTNVFLSYSEAVLPGFFNDTLASLDPADLAYAQSLYPELEVEVDQEKLKAYELGFKQSALDGALWYSIVGFYQEWDGQKSSGQFPQFTNPDTGYTSPIFLIATTTGSSTQTGIETEGRWMINENLNLQFAYGYVESEYDNYTSNALRSALGLPRGTFLLANGNTLPRSPKHSGAIGLTYSDELTSEWGYSARVDATYRGETYTDELNLTTINGYSLMNMRLSFENNDGLALELFCSNCLDKEGWATGRRSTDFTHPLFAATAAVVDPITPREVGVRFRYDF